MTLSHKQCSRMLRIGHPVDNWWTILLSSNIKARFRKFLAISCKFLPKISSNHISGGPATLAQRAWSEPTQKEGPQAPVCGAWAAIWSWGQNSDIVVIRSFAQLRFARWRSSIGCFIVFLLYMFFFLILHLCPDKPLHAGSCNILSFSIHMFVKVTVFYRSLTVKWKRLFQMPLQPSFRQYCTQGKEKQMSHTGNTQSRHRDHLMRKKLERKKGFVVNSPDFRFFVGGEPRGFCFLLINNNDIDICTLTVFLKYHQPDASLIPAKLPYTYRGCEGGHNSHPSACMQYRPKKYTNKNDNSRMCGNGDNNNDDNNSVLHEIMFCTNFAQLRSALALIRPAFSLRHLGWRPTLLACQLLLDAPSQMLYDIEVRIAIAADFAQRVGPSVQLRATLLHIVDNECFGWPPLEGKKVACWPSDRSPQPSSGHAHIWPSCTLPLAPALAIRGFTFVQLLQAFQAKRSNAHFRIYKCHKKCWDKWNGRRRKKPAIIYACVVYKNRWENQKAACKPTEKETKRMSCSQWIAEMLTE